MSLPPAAITHRAILAIAVPMTLGYLTVPLVGLVDMAVVGQLGVPAAMGGVALASVLFDILFGTFNFLRSGTTGLVAQALGRGDGGEQMAVAWRAVLLALALGVAMLVLKAPILGFGLYCLGGSAHVQAATTTYFDIRILAAPAALINFAIFGWLLGLGRAGLGLALQTLLNATNIALSVWLGLGLGWGIAGVAWGTLCAEVITALVGLAILVRHGLRVGTPTLGAIFERTRFAAMLGVNRDIMIRSFVLLTVFFYFAGQSARFGDVTLAGNAILEKFFLLSSYVLDGFAAAAETFVGRAVGARDRTAFLRAVRLTTIWGYGMAALSSAAVLGFGPALIAVMTTSGPVRAAAAAFLPYAALTPLVGFGAFQMDGVFIGATWSRDMRNMMLASLGVFFAVWLPLGPLIGNHALWLALLAFLGARGLSLWLVMRRRVETGFAG